MDVVALISGGKDSTFNLMHCVANGYRIVALANLKPPEGIDELDSWMYQSVGHDLIQAYQQCLGIPLYRRTIEGKALVQSYSYHPDPHDEVEDLFALLQQVLQEHPSIKYVSVGAILSNYQRIRVEQVCKRLHLQPLSWLWQQPQSELLRSMIANGLDAMVIKVAAMGLTQRDLGINLQQLEKRIGALPGLNPCGEGGEYETLTLDCPLFLHRIVIDSHEIVTLRECSIAPVAFLKVVQYHTECKLPIPTFTLHWQQPPVYDWFTSPTNKSEYCVGQLNEFEFTNDIQSVIKQKPNFLLVAMSQLKELDFSTCSDDPPTKVCIQLPNIPTKYAFKSISTNLPCKYLTVASSSYWAPSSHGHYSQLIQWTDDESNQAILSGVRGIIPQHDKLVEGGIQPEFNLIVQHIQRILQASQFTLSRVSHLNVFITNQQQISLVNEAVLRAFPSTSNITYFSVEALEQQASLEIQALVNVPYNIITGHQRYKQ